MADIKPTSVPSKRLAASIDASASSLQLNNIQGWDGNDLTSSDFGTVMYAVLRNDSNTIMELIELDPTTIASSSITINKRGLKFTGDLTTEVTANKKTWVKNATIVELGSNPPQLLQHFVDILSDETVAGTKTFSSFPQKSGSTTPTANAELATKEYVDSVVGGTAAYDQNLITGTAGEDLTAGQVVYFKTSDQKWYKADSDDDTKSINVKLGFANEAILTDATGTICINGLAKSLTGLTAGSRYYLSNTAGSIATSPGDNNRFVGWALSTTTLMIDTENTSLEEGVEYGTSGQALAIGDWVYFKESDGKWWDADASAVATARDIKLGVVQTASTGADEGILVRISGVDRTQSGLTAGTRYFISDTAATISATQGTIIRFAGIALSATEILLANDSFYGVSQDGSEIYAADAEASDTYVITLVPAPKALVAGMVVNFKANTANTGACTLNVNSLGAVSIKKNHDQDPADGDIESGQVVTVIYDGTNFQMQSQIGNTPISNASYVADTDNVVATHSGDTNETTLATLTLPAGVMLANGTVKIRVNWRAVNTGGGAGTQTMRVKFGGTTIATHTRSNTSGAPDQISEITVHNVNSVSAQDSSDLHFANDGASPSLKAVNTSQSVATVNTDSAVTVLVTGQLSDGAHDIWVDQAVMEVLPKS